MWSGRHSALVCVVLGVIACGRIGYDPVQAGISSTGLAGATGAGARGMGGMSGNGGMTGNGGVTGNGGMTGNAGKGGSASPSDASADLAPPSDAAADLTPPNDASGPPATCTQAGSPTMIWPFDADVQGWQLSGAGTLAWSGTIGSPSPGSLQVDWGSGQAIQILLMQAFGNLTGRIVTARVWLDTGGAVSARIFVQTGTRSVWADSGYVTLSQGQWTCLALDIDNPVFSRQQYDPTDVEILGLDMQANGTSRVYIDTVAY